MKGRKVCNAGQGLQVGVVAQIAFDEVHHLVDALGLMAAQVFFLFVLLWHNDAFVYIVKLT